jgi:glycosyltransferase involved in cell wall biosynthesis
MPAVPSNKLKILIVAMTCDADEVSEALCAYQIVNQISKQHDVTLLVQNKPSRYGLVIKQLPNCRVIEFKAAEALYRFERFSALFKPGFFQFYVNVRKKIRALVTQESFDLIHQLTPFAPRYPSPCFGFGLPFIYGPIGGAVEVPVGFRSVEKSMAWYTKLRVLDHLRFKFDPWLRRGFKRADLVLGVAPYIKGHLDSVRELNFKILNENGVRADEINRPNQGHNLTSINFRLLYVGRVIRTKGLYDLINAMADLRDDNVSLDVVGAGDDLTNCIELTSRLQLEDKIVFHGRKARTEVDAFYRQSDVFVFPSFRESSGGVILEAMCHGLPVVCSSNGGPGFLVDETCGIKVTPITPEQYAHDLAVAIRRVISEKDLKENLSVGAIRRVETEFTWEVKAKKLTQIYNDVLAGSQKED